MPSAPEPPTGATTPPPAGVAGETPPAGNVGVAWDAPRRWVATMGSGMRFLTYAVPGAPAAPDGDCGVYFFGPSNGGGVEPNLARWQSEFENGTPRRSTRTVHGLPVTEFDIAGTYRAHADMSGTPVAPQPHFALLGAIVQGPNGDVFFTLLGPEHTVKAAEPEFDAMVNSVRPRAIKPRA